MTEIPERAHHFSPDERQRILDQLLTALREDPRVAGVLIVGSGADGFDDAYSDIDLCVVIAQPEDVHPTFEAWGERLEQLLPVFFRGKSVRGPNILLAVLLLEKYLEVDISFLCLDDLEARKSRWKTAFDRSGRIEQIMQTSWAQRSGPAVRSVYEHHVNWLWHHVLHANVAIQRGQPWRALYELEQVRDQTIELRGLRQGLITKRFRYVDQMSPDFLSQIESTLVTEVQPAALKRALRQACRCFLAEARQLGEMLCSELDIRVSRKLNDYLALWD